MEACLSLCAQLPSVVRAYPAELKALAAMLRLRLFEAISLMPPAALEKSYTQLLRLLVSASITVHDLILVASRGPISYAETPDFTERTFAVNPSSYARTN